MPKGDVAMVKLEQSIMINRPVEEVWKFMSNWENGPKWDCGVVEARQISEGRWVEELSYNPGANAWVGSR
ncbi:MAG: hypothetical protein HW378_2299 [Anaerolineales bacterium]|nr:hypothetical protein [Anaerolineales bacterium]